MNGSGGTVALTGAKDQVTVAGTGGSVTVNGGTVTLKEGAVVTVSGNSNSIAVGKGGILNAASGAGNVVKVTGTGAVVALGSSEMDLASGSTAQAFGNQNVYTLASNASLTGAGLMKSTGSGTDKVPYQLRSVSASGLIWGNTATTTSAGNGVAGTGNGLQQSLTVYASVPSAEYTPGSYSDTVTVYVNY